MLFGVAGILYAHPQNVRVIVHDIRDVKYPLAQVADQLSPPVLADRIVGRLEQRFHRHVMRQQNLFDALIFQRDGVKLLRVDAQLVDFHAFTDADSLMLPRAAPFVKQPPETLGQLLFVRVACTGRNFDHHHREGVVLVKRAEHFTHAVNDIRRQPGGKRRRRGSVHFT